MPRLTHEQAEYLKSNAPRFGDNKLARALDRDKAWVRAALEEIGCVRTPEDLKYIHSHPHEQPPEFEGKGSEPFIPQSPLPGRTKGMLGLAFLIPALLSALTTTSSPAGRNAAELSLCAYGLGLPQDPVGPIYLIVGFLLSFVPLGGFALRLHLVSLVCGAAASFWMAHILYRLFRSLPASLFLPGLLACSVPVWGASVETSPAPIAFFLLALCFHHLTRGYETRTETPLIWAVLCGSAALATDVTLLPFAPIFFLFLAAIHRRRKARLALWIGLAVLGLFVFHLFLYPLFLSWTHPPLARVALRDLGDLGRYLALPYAQGAFSFAHFATNARVCGEALVPGKSLFLALPLALLALGAFLYGMAYLWKERRPLFLLLAAALLVSLALFSFFPAVSAPLLFLALFAFLAPVGKVLSALFAKGKAVAFACGILAVFGLLAQGFASLPSASRRGWDFPERYARAVLEATEAPAVIVPGDETAAFFLLNESLVARPDPEKIVCNVFGKDRDLASLSKQDPERCADEVAARYPGKTIYLTALPELRSWHRYDLQRIGLVWRATPIVRGRRLAEGPKREMPAFPAFSERQIEGENRLLSQCHLLRAMDELERGESAAAVRSLAQARYHSAQSRELLLHHARSLAASRKYDEAMTLYRALFHEPTAEICLDMARIETIRGNRGEAESLYKKALELSPNSFNAMVELARQYEREEKPDKAAELYRRLIERYKDAPYPYRQLAKLLARDPARKQEADELNARAAELEKKEAQKTESLKSIPVPKLPGKKEEEPWLPKLPQIGPSLPEIPGIPGHQEKRP